MTSMERTETDNLCRVEVTPRSSTPPPVYGEIPGVVPMQTATSTGPPPSYEEANSLDALPPSYNSLFGQVKQARRSSDGLLEFLKKLSVLICGTIGCTILVGITIIIPLSMIYIGCYYLYDCTAEHYIPIFLIVGGIFGLLKNLTNSWRRCRKSMNEEEEDQKQSPFDTMLNCFLFAWFIAGSVWVYKECPPEYLNEASRNYCDKTLYMFSFWLLTSIYILLSIGFCCICTISAWSLADSEGS